ncbi:diguanylate cyclase (GGDEF)-like protein [Mycolicibacterium sp. BK556]|uniref:putative bifunctional diguanylate cyclase/phosphodiesterase n=1 Tax=unclassified Mycolicibacterium TaxID=2636767 RepID=UPI0016099277|nr:MULTISPECIES: EAL domain-containing protein [unclassified Mycolicibacterium]MBB3603816.1 diguanylate cyclase (GGDEF)-like protein [Mycolicibacterium sp. BK556]MBB3634011.1 diguanylate cyclase (GGDEF)-like protein [Mycolicibacterium sp. BK607]MBB3751592.1 diguanylate cyclase (GGDEF)-like protein [Mycolicibacterium sp. BK634]
MPLGSRRLRSGLSAAVVVAAGFNALALWGQETAQRVQFVIEATLCVAALIVGIVVARRVTGLSRWWRVTLVVAIAVFLTAEFLARGDHAVDLNATAPALAVAGYFIAGPLFAAAMLLLVRAGHRDDGRTWVRTWPVLTTVLDGSLATLAFSHLVYVARLGAMDGAALPRSTNAGVVFGIGAVELVTVVGAILLAMWYPPYRPGRANYMLLASSVITLTSADRLLAYFRSIGVPELDPWVGIGFVIAPLLIMLSLLEFPPRPRPDHDELEQPTNWAQLTLPYVGFMGSTALLAFHVLVGARVDPVFIGTYLAMALLVATRYVVAMRVQRMLTEQLVEAKRRLAHQAHHDALTGLPNRLLLAQRLDEAIRDGPFVLIFVDIDDFKEVNDQFGHAAGDELLCAISARLESCLGPGDTLARIGGDEFAILIAGAVGAPEIVADQLRVALRSPFSVHATSVRVRASMGLVSPGSDGVPPTSDDLLKQADNSMYTGKRLGKDTAVVYRPAFSVSEDFPTALRQAKGGAPQGFHLKYQPIVTLPQGIPVAVEALARWTAPSGIQIPPQTFVSLAEANGMGAQLDALVLDQACAQIKASGLDLDVHINIGAARLGSVEFEHVVSRTLARHLLPPQRLVLEITETVPIVDLADGAAAIRRLNELGVRVALDDFGAGYNSLTYLHELPVQIVKLDRGLAMGVEPERNLLLYRSVTGLCEALGLNVIAEGIETADQAETIYMAGCGLAQGHLFGRASTLADIADEAVRPY